MSVAEIREIGAWISVIVVLLGFIFLMWMLNK